MCVCVCVCESRQSVNDLVARQTEAEPEIMDSKNAKRGQSAQPTRQVTETEPKQRGTGRDRDVHTHTQRERGGDSQTDSQTERDE